MRTPSIETIEKDGVTLAILVRKDYSPTATSFLTPVDFKQQLGFIVYPAGGEIARHVHHAGERTFVGMSEVLVLKSGRCRVDIYAPDRELVATRELCTGDVLMLVAGGHGFHMLEPTVFIEVKQGPYIGLDEKEHF